MTKQFSRLALTVLAILAGCTKPTVNNTINVSTAELPSFTVSGLTNLTVTNGGGTYDYVSCQLTVNYNDSAQQMVTLSLSGLPAGITLDSADFTATAYPNFSTAILLYDSTLAGATPGIYDLTLTATGSLGEVRSYPFKLTVKAPPPCTSTVVGKYISCYCSCNSTGNYTDSVYADPNTLNKIWFKNFANTGQLVYGILLCSASQVQIPAQTVGSYTFSGTGSFSTGLIDFSSLIINGVACECYDEN